ncbi:MAG TPA: polyhydroxyalkanoate depolymerase [Paraburkholderia sp.]|nr:polyhydroxyalkanoate depolymerase [Paraburkholderia sp.]
MWYAWLEAQHKLLQMLGGWPAHSDDASPFPPCPDASPAARGASWLSSAIGPTSEPPPFGISSVRIGECDVPVIEQVIDSVPFCALRKFSRASSSTAPAVPANGLEPMEIFVCAPLAGHHAVMLCETVETLLQCGNVCITDWANARDVPLADGRFDLDDYVLTIERFMQSAGADRLHVLAVCQATGPALAATALRASAGEATPLSLTLMGGPIDASLNPTAIDRFARSHSIDWFRDTVIDVVPPPYPGAGRRVYPGFIQHAAIVASHPERQWAVQSRYWASQLSGDPQAIAQSLHRLREYTAVLDMAEAYFLDMIRVFFHETRLARGDWQVGTRAVRPQDLATAALCTVEGSRDTISGAGQTHVAQSLCSGIQAAARRRLTIPDCDHYGLFTGPRWRELIYPELVEFWRVRQ